MDKQFSIFNFQFSKSSGYTLIELLVVIGLSVILLITALSLFFTTFIGGGKTASGEYTKQAGQNTISQITFLLRNARKLVPNTQNKTCAGAMSSIGIMALDGTVSIISTDPSTGQIKSDTGGFLTPPDLNLSAPLVFDCSPTDYGTSTWDGSPPKVDIHFSLRKGTAGVDNARDIVSIPFQSSVTLRNF